MKKEQSEEATIAVLGEKVDSLRLAFQKMEGKLDNMANNFITQQQLTDALKPLRERQDWTEKFLYGVGMAVLGQVLYLASQFILKQ